MISGLLTIIRGTSNGNSTTLLPLTVISNRSLEPRTLNVTPGGGGTCPRASGALPRKQPRAHARGKATLAANPRAVLCDRFDIRVFLVAASAWSFHDPFRGSIRERRSGKDEHASLDPFTCSRRVACSLH